VDYLLARAAVNQSAADRGDADRVLARGWLGAMRRWSVRPAQLAPVFEVADLQIDLGANVVELSDQLRVACRDEIRLDLTQVCGSTFEPSKSMNVDHAPVLGKTRAVLVTRDCSWVALSPYLWFFVGSVSQDPRQRHLLDSEALDVPEPRVTAGTGPASGKGERWRRRVGATIGDHSEAGRR